MKVIIAWNTGAQYTRAGQRIAAGKDADGVYFVDLDRMIYGKFTVPWLGSSLGLTAEWVHRQYLENLYEDLSPSDKNVKALLHCAAQVRGLDE